MTWTPAHGPSREELAQLAEAALPDGWVAAAANLGLAAHDLYEENQRLKGAARTGGSEFMDMIAECNQLRMERQLLKAELAEAKRDTERLDWLECGDSITGHVTRLAAAENYWAGPKGTTFRAAIDGSMKGDTPSEHRKGD